MTIIAFPTDIKAPSEVTWQLRANTQTHTSPFDGTAQTLVMPGARWEGTVTWATLSLTERRTMEAFLARLGGMAGRFTMPVYHAPRRALGAGTPVMASSSQSGSTISVSGWAASADALQVGDFLSYTDAAGRTLLHVCTASVTANGSGVASISIAPPVRRSVAAGTAVQVTAPVGLFRLKSDEEGVMTTRPPLLGAVSISICEALF